MRAASLIALTILLSQQMMAAAYADPPPWAPAHGRRDRDAHYDYPRYHHRHDRNDVRRYEYREYRARPVLVAPVVQSRPYVEVRCDNSKPILAAILGGAAGGLVGHQFGSGRGNTAATISGTLLGAVIGNQLGVSLQRVDADCFAQSFEYAQPGTQVVWAQDDAAYTVLPTRNFRRGNQYCREYQARVSVGGRIEDSYGTACRQPDGPWQIVN